MALPNTGAITLNEVNVELGNPGTSQIGMNDAAVRGLFQVPTGAISMSDGYGKSSQFSFTISSNTSNANLQTLATNAGWNGSSKVVATINPGVYISSTSTGSSALTIPASFPGGVELINYGVIVGRGGNGGAGAPANRYFNSANTTSGSAGAGGGRALTVSGPVSINNAGTIAGGGGGGGGGGGARMFQNAQGKGNDYYGSAVGAGGGGGRSSLAANASGGAAGTRFGSPSFLTPSIGPANAGGTGTVNTAGGGGSATYSPNVGFYHRIRGGFGASGGNWGSGGGTGGTAARVNFAPGSSYSLYGGGAGGAAGGAISGNPYITWVATGTRLGPIV